MRTNVWLLILGCLCVAGCTSAWIENPSPTTRNLVNDLRLEGFDCNARHSEIECLQAEPLRNKQPAKCDSVKGCVDQPDVLIYNRYHIQQQDNGLPSLKHEIVEKVDQQLFGSTTVKPDNSDGNQRTE